MADPFTIMMVVTVASTVLGVVGSVAEHQAQKEAGKRQEEIGRHQKALADRQAEVMEQEAGVQRAVGQRQAIEQRRRGEYIQSRAAALTGASGAGALDPTAVNMMGALEGETELRAANELFMGEETGRGLDYGAEIERSGGLGAKAAADAKAHAAYSKADQALFKAGGTILSGIGTATMYGKFGQGGPPGTATPPTRTYRYQNNPRATQIAQWG